MYTPGRNNLTGFNRSQLFMTEKICIAKFTILIIQILIDSTQSKFWNKEILQETKIKSQTHKYVKELLDNIHS